MELRLINQYLVIVFSVGLSRFLAGFTGSIIIPIFPALVGRIYGNQSLGNSSSDSSYNYERLGLLFGCKGITLFLSSPLTGLLIERFSLRFVFMLGLSLRGVSLLMFAFVDQYWLLIVSRLVEGWSTSSLSCSLDSLISSQFTSRSVLGFLYGVYSLFLFIGLSVGPVAGGSVYERFGKRIPFLGCLILTVIEAVVVMILIWKGTQDNNNNILEIKMEEEEEDKNTKEEHSHLLQGKENEGELKNDDHGKVRNRLEGEKKRKKKEVDIEEGKLNKNNRGIKNKREKMVKGKCNGKSWNENNGSKSKEEKEQMIQGGMEKEEKKRDGEESDEEKVKEGNVEEFIAERNKEKDHILEERRKEDDIREKTKEVHEDEEKVEENCKIEEEMMLEGKETERRQGKRESIEERHYSLRGEKEENGGENGVDTQEIESTEKNEERENGIKSKGVGENEETNKGRERGCTWLQGTGSMKAMGLFLVDPFFLIALWAQAVNLVARYSYYTVLPRHMLLSFSVSEFRQGAVFMLNILGYLCGFFVGGMLNMKFKSRRCVILGIFSVLHAALVLSMAFMPTWWSLSLPLCLLSFQNMVFDIIMAPIFVSITEQRHQGRLGLLSGLKVMNLAFASGIASLVAPVVYRRLGFLWLSVAMATVNCCYVPFYYFLIRFT